jgi:hypothetical protein
MHGRMHASLPTRPKLIHFSINADVSANVEVISYQSSSLFNQADVSFFTEIFKKQ